MNADAPMEVDESSAIQEIEITIKDISSITYIRLSNSIPKYASSNREEWSAKEEQEALRRSGEYTSVQSHDFKIETQLRKLKRLVLDRNLEVDRINKRRNQYDEIVKVQRTRKLEGRKIKQRRWEEAQSKQEFLDSLEMGKYKKD
ncbi:Protein CBG23767 [Caenorhabditis briggsae]|uniref:Uncharacterized protein n=2 Tax=Caenorhabditis briggsae TaxID=6238 RepID=A0AAE8ZXX6_CAEBR|nr:Protein CBG23767 [Caenorhabditis briggsae]ULT85358.1 hypothetical protein L3Y34_013878 [Caenorhabditis briggsae]CAP20533.1 Protein CBG23767 [Caenorhabditis briggsae]